MIRQLKSKGFKSSSIKGFLEGEFNGSDVYVGVLTNNNKVYRVGLIDVNYVDEVAIKIRFNNLIYQFKNNPKYSGEADLIPDDEDIEYEMMVNDKRYEAVFYQKSMFAPLDSTAIQEKIYSLQKERFTPEEIANPTPEIKEELDKIRNQYWADSLRDTLGFLFRPVLFMISKSESSYGKYHIVMAYDNEYNKANGEDL